MELELERGRALREREGALTGEVGRAGLNQDPSRAANLKKENDLKKIAIDKKTREVGEARRELDSSKLELALGLESPCQPFPTALLEASGILSIL